MATSIPLTGTPAIKYPSNIAGLTRSSTYPATEISSQVYAAAKAALYADPINGHRQAYAILYEATGNPAFRDNLFIATRSGTVGGVAWNANQQILEQYPVAYPKDGAGNLSIGKFSWLVGQANIDLLKETAPGKP